MKIKNLSLVLLLSAFIVITGVIFLKNYETETLVDAKWNEKEDTLLAITIDGEDANAFPTTNTYTAIVNCSNGAGTATNPYKVAYKYLSNKVLMSYFFLCHI